jgi:predicted metal-dependent HD superfamily phosphohydrolase
MADSSNSVVEIFIRSEFAKVIKKLKGDEKAIHSWTNSLREAYTEPQRYYHTINHIYSMLHCLQEKSIFINDQTAIQLAIFFHDWVYDSAAHDNELQSIKVFQTFAHELNISKSLQDRVSSYIEATITHSLGLDNENDYDLKHFLDFDLEVLAREPAEYALYSAQIRKEYAHFTDDEYVSGRLGVLQKFLGRKRLFFSDVFYENCEVRARNNLETEIVELKESVRNSPMNEISKRDSI